MALRVCLVPLFVVLCYQFEWTAWRSLTCEAFLKLASWIGIPAVRVSPWAFTSNGHAYLFVISCTALDAFFGSVPLLWRARKSVLANSLFLAGYFVVLSIVNLLRLQAGFLLYAGGIPWSLAHEGMSGVFYFGLLLWILRQRGWQPPLTTATAAENTSPRE